MRQQLIRQKNWHRFRDMLINQTGCRWPPRHGLIGGCRNDGVPCVLVYHRTSGALAGSSSASLPSATVYDFADCSGEGVLSVGLHRTRRHLPEPVWRLASGSEPIPGTGLERWQKFFSSRFDASFRYFCRSLAGKACSSAASQRDQNIPLAVDGRDAGAQPLGEGLSCSLMCCVL